MADYDSDAVQVMTKELGRALYRALPQGATAVVLDFTQVGLASGGHAIAYTEAGDRLQVRLGIESYDLAEELRAAMYRPGAGTWFSAKVTVTAQGSMDADFNYDDEPQWEEGILDHWFVTDLERFPRDESAQPEWLKAKIAHASA